MKTVVVYMLLGAIAFGGYSYLTRKPACAMVGYRAVHTEAERIMLDMMQKGFQLAAICAQFHELQEENTQERWAGGELSAYLSMNAEDAPSALSSSVVFREFPLYHRLYFKKEELDVDKLTYGLALESQVASFNERLAN